MTELVGGEIVTSHVAYGRRRADAVEDLLHDRAYASLGGAARTARRYGAGSTSQIEEMGALGAVKV